MKRTIITILSALCLPALLFAQEETFDGKDAAHWTAELTKTESTENLQNRTRWYAGYALGEIGAPAASSVDALCERLLDIKEYEYTRAVCAWALGRIQEKKAVPALTEALKSKMDAVRITTSQALGAFGSEAESAAESLSALLDGKPLDGSESESNDAFQSELIEPVKAAVAAALWKVAPADSPNAQKGKDALLGIPNPVLRQIAAKYSKLPRDDVESLLQSRVHEFRFVALCILQKQYKKNPNASIYFYHKGLIKYTGVMLKGKMEVLTDQQSKK